MELAAGSNVILATPTGSGKSLVAIAAHFQAMARGQRSYYTAPIKALVSEKFFALCEIFGAENVGMITGDSGVNQDAPIICCTAEILANIALREGAAADLGSVIMDEFHFYSDPQRGWAWQVPLLELPQAQFLLMSATLGDVSRFEDGHHRPDRPPDDDRQFRGTPHPAALLLRADPGPRDPRGAARHEAGARLRGALQPGGGHRPRPEPDEHQRLHPRGKGQDRRADRRLPVRRRLRQDPQPAGPARHRRPPRRHAAEVPPARGAAGPGRPAQGHLRHGHPRRRHQRAHPHGAAHRAEQVRRRPHPAAELPGVPPDRRPGRPGRLRHRRDRGGAGPGARHRERQGDGQGHRQVRRRPEEAAPGGQEEAARGLRVLGRAHVQAARRIRSGSADLQFHRDPRDADEPDGTPRRPVQGRPPAAHRKPRDRVRPSCSS